MDFSNLKVFMDKMSDTRTPGNAVEVCIGGKTVFRYVSGYADLETKTPLTGDEMYNIYSCSKLTTVTAGAQLLERGQFLLTDPLYAYMPEFRKMYIKTAEGNLIKAQNPITIGHLFTMTAGFSYDLNSPGYQKARELTGGKMNTADTIRCVAADPISFEPGSHWQYSICHDVLAGVIEVITGMKFREYVKKNIFEPLDMHDSVYHHTRETLKKTASQYMAQPSGEEADLVEMQKNGTVGSRKIVNVGKAVSLIPGEEYDSGGAGISTTVSDYAKFLTALANRGIGKNGEKILSGHTVDLLRTDCLTPEQRKDFCWQQLKGCGYGLGVHVHVDPAASGTNASIGQFGWGGAAGATAIADPSLGLAVFYAQHLLNPGEEYYQPRLKNVIYSCLD